jgi:hypothetical protein
MSVLFISGYNDEMVAHRRIADSETHFLHKPFLAKDVGVSSLRKAIIDRFVRYLRRNEVLGRSSTPEDEAFLTKPSSSF